MITGTQCKMARVALNWTGRDLGKVADLHWTVIARFEAGGPGSDIRISSMRKIETALAELGFQFPDDQTVRMPPGLINATAANGTTARFRTAA
jgi:predicted transcriptional regulator